MNSVEILGYLATALTVVAFAPQVWRVWKLRETRDISLATFALLFLGATVWLIYGILIGSPPIVLTNAALAFFQGIIMIFKLKYG